MTGKLKWCVIFLMLLFTQCGPTRTVTIKTLQPAALALPADVNQIVLVDRTRFSNELLNLLEGILTGELPEDDRAAAQQVLRGLQSQMRYSPRYRIQVASERLDGNSINKVFPQMLSWNVVNDLCSQYNSQMLVALEIFDTDFIVTDGVRNKKQTVGEGTSKKEIPVTEYYAKGVGNVNIGIRLYYPKEKRLIDEALVSESHTWEAQGTSRLDAIAALISKSEANRSLARMVGEDYAYKISPMPALIKRPFYGKSKKSEALAQGTRYADVGNWQAAIDAWKSGLQHSETREAGYLAYNIAIGYEVLGDFDAAIKWAQDAYTNYGNREARAYANQLTNRKLTEQVLQEQMKRN